MTRKVICGDCGKNSSLYALGLCRNCYQRAWRGANPDKVKEQNEYRLRWGKEHKKEIRTYGHEWYEENKEKQKSDTARWRGENPGKRAIYRVRRRTRKRNLPSTLTAMQMARKLSIGQCFYCDNPIENLTLDHFIPVSRGGGTTLANSVAACRRCNARKYNRMPEDILVQLPFI